MSTTIPVEVDEVTASWMSEALGVPVASVDVLDAHSGTTGRARVGVTYDGAAADGGLPDSVFVKLAPFDPRQRKFVDMTGLGVAEAHFYRDVASQVPVRVPEVHFAATDDDGRYVMVLEDLVASGCHFPSPGDDDVADSVAAIIDALARLHARYWGDPRLDGDLAWVRTGNRVGFEHGGPFFARALEQFGEQMGPTFRRLATLYVEQAPAIAALLAAGPPTLIHGDPHLGNLFVDQGRAGFFDWGMVWCATGMRDFAYVLGNSTPTDVRRAHESAWLDHYLGVLRAEGIELDRALAWEQYRLLVIYAWSSATSTATMGSRWQTVEVGQGGMARATAAVEDLASVALLEALL